MVVLVGCRERRSGARHGASEGGAGRSGRGLGLGLAEAGAEPYRKHWVHDRSRGQAQPVVLGVVGEMTPSRWRGSSCAGQKQPQARIAVSVSVIAVLSSEVLSQISLGRPARPSTATDHCLPYGAHWNAEQRQPAACARRCSQPLATDASVPRTNQSANASRKLLGNRKAGVSRSRPENPLLAKGAHLHGVDREAPRRITSTAVLFRQRRISCLLDCG